MDSKTCYKCDIEMPIESFNKNKTRKSGVSDWCKSCTKESKAKYYLENKSRVLMANNIYAKENKEEIKKTKKEWRNKNKSRILRKASIYYQNNKEKIKEYGKKYIEKNRGKLWRDLPENKEQISAKQSEYYENHKIIIKIYSSEYKKINRCKYNVLQQQRRSMIHKALSTLTKKQWEDVKQKFNNCCCYCGKELPLTQEHFIPLSKDGEYTVNNIIPSCQICNSSKNNKDFFKWFPKSRHYSKKREKFILDHLQYTNEYQQLALTL